MRTLVATLACRAHGTRLYGKPLQALDVARQISVLDYMIAFIKSEPTIAEAVLGVAEGIENEPFHAIATRHGLRSIRGDERDVLQRLILCCRAAGGTDAFRVTTESPFTYFEPIAEAWRRHVEHGNDVTAIAGVPDGPVFEIIRLEALERSHALGDARHRSELCTLYIREHQQDFRVETIEAPAAVNRMDLRLTIDYPEDLVVCRRVYEAFKDLAPRIPLDRIVQFLDANVELKQLVQPFAAMERWFK
jgi:spore coat polysaccharide biosynthesis protein SpsF